MLNEDKIVNEQLISLNSHFSFFFFNYENKGLRFLIEAKSQITNRISNDINGLQTISRIIYQFNHEFTMHKYK